MPIAEWTQADQSVTRVLAQYGLAEAEVHTAWLLRRLIEQEKIPNFSKLDHAQRRSAVERYRAGELLRLQKTSHKAYNQAKKNYRHTHDYVHLTAAERREAVMAVADVVSSWDFAVLFAEAINKLHFDEARTGRTVSEQAFEQLVTRFEHFLKKDNPEATLGVLVHDNNQTVAKKHTDMMRDFHLIGTLWAKIRQIAETPLFVDSRLTRMIQMADLCSYAMRRYVENGELELFERIFKRGHTYKEKVVGVRHFTARDCVCIICAGHRPKRAAQSRVSAA